MFDILVLSAPKDYNKLPYLYDSITKNMLDKWNNFYIISPTEIENKNKDINYLLDHEALNIDRRQFRHRPNWIFQQFCKLFQNVTTNDYLVIDSDVILNSPISLYTNNKPTFFLGRDQHHIQYFNFMDKIMKLEKNHPHSFISEIMYFKKDIVNDILNKCGGFESFYEKSISLIGSDCYISEFELYGNYVMKYFSELYEIKNIKSNLSGKHRQWFEQEIKNYILEYKNSDYEILSMHSWC